MKNKESIQEEISGMSFDEAETKLKAKGMCIRTTIHDGRYCIGTCDLRNDRVNVEVSDGKVVKVTSIG
jgi:hypothetical protein